MKIVPEETRQAVKQARSEFSEQYRADHPAQSGPLPEDTREVSYIWSYVELWGAMMPIRRAYRRWSPWIFWALVFSYLRFFRYC